MAFYGWPVSQCQEPSDTLSAQLLAGIRVLDVRLAVVPVTAKYLPFNFKSKSTPAPVPNPTSTDPPGAVTATTTSAEPELRLLAYHGIYPQRTPFTTILSTIHTFLNSPAGQSETIVMSLKQEDFQVTSKDVWARLVREEIMASPGGFKNTGPDGKRDMGMWYLENRIPTLGEVRGKVVMFSRFNGDKQNWEGGTQGMGIHPTRWPNSDRNGFVWKLKGTTVRTHDWYAIPSFLSVPEKVTLSTSVLHPTISVPLTFPLPEPGNVYDDTEPQLSITYLSAATFPLALPPFVAKGIGFPGWKLGFEGVNSRTAKWLLEELVPALRSTPAAQLHDQAVANADVNTATRDGPVDPDTLRRRRLRWWRKEKKVVDDRGAAARGAQASASGVANAGGVDGADQTHASDTQVIPSTTMESRRLRGWVMLDYYTSDSGLVPLLIECNYRARKSGQEGWP
ncbi:hypothetical protein CC2G_006167 [Coprinopsis cinerea AmutBmut pab1-1]|nr:hypothetical protein CC2G_006167 [Coprinopsis cinerea AmutBmut pab1-1]